jgi:hypothetical protein
MLVIFFSVGCSSTSSISRNRIEFQKAQLDGIGAALWSFHSVHGHFPPTGTNLIVLAKLDGVLQGAAHLGVTARTLRSERLVDSWGREFGYRNTGGSCVVTCRGSDGQLNTADDFVMRVTSTKNVFEHVPRLTNE